MTKTYHIPCKNCSGKGHIEKFQHIEGGLCFSCDGSKIEQTSKEEYENWLTEEKRKQHERKNNYYYVFNNGQLDKFHAKNLSNGIMFHEDYTYNGVNILSVTTLSYGDRLKIKGWKSCPSDKEVLTHLITDNHLRRIEGLEEDLKKEMDEEWQEMLNDMIKDYQERIKQAESEATTLLENCR